MGALLVYVVKSAVCLALLFAGYRLWLRSETLHGMNRATLLGICVASFVLPALGGAWMRLVGLPSSGGIDVGAVLVATAEAVPAEVASGSPVSWQSAVVALYLAGLAIFFLRGGIGLFQLLRLLRSGRRPGWRMAYGWWYTDATWLHSAGGTVWSSARRTCRHTAITSWLMSGNTSSVVTRPT